MGCIECGERVAKDSPFTICDECLAKRHCLPAATNKREPKMPHKTLELDVKESVRLALILMVRRLQLIDYITRHPDSCNSSEKDTVEVIDSLLKKLD